jgi:mono/diheme cytochrome c family protein
MKKFLSRRLAVQACVALSGVVLLAGCAVPPSASDAVAVARAGPTAPDAAQIYLRRCSVCHGEKGDGYSHARSALAKAPRDFTTENARLELTREYMTAIVRDGRPGSPMVGRHAQLSDEEIEAVVGFILAAFVAPDPASPAGQGRALYRSWCASCHGGRGEGGTPKPGIRRASELSLARPGSTLTVERLLAAMGNDQHLTALEGRTLGDAERQAVLAYIRQAFIEPLGGQSRAGASPAGPALR